MTVLRARELYRFYRVGDEETLALRGVSIEVPAGKAADRGRTVRLR